MAMSMKRRAMFTCLSFRQCTLSLDYNYSGVRTYIYIHRGGTQLPETNHSWPSDCYNANLCPMASRVVIKFYLSMQNPVNLIV